MSALDARPRLSTGHPTPAVELAIRWQWSAIAAAESGATAKPASPPGPHDLLSIELRLRLSPSDETDSSGDLRARAVAGEVRLRVAAPPHLSAMAFDAGVFAAHGTACRTRGHLHLDLDGETGPLLRWSVPVDLPRAGAAAMPARGTYLRSPLLTRIGVRGGTSGVGMLAEGGSGLEPARFIATLLGDDQEPASFIAASSAV